ncbi:MAG TPA: transposase [Polyangiaceae bacterium]
MHAKQRVDGRDRAQIERLCRYITRPPLSQERLTRRADGRLELELKNVWRDGTRALVLEPFDLLTRLVASVPPFRASHLLRYFGVLSSHSALRREVVPVHPCDPAQRRPPAATGEQLSLPTLGGDDAPSDDRPPPRNSWAWLLAHVFRADLEVPPLRWAYALGRGCAHSAFYRQALGRVRHGAPISTPRAPTLVEPALSLPFAR